MGEERKDCLFIFCDCGGCSALELSFWEEDDIENDQVFLSFWSPYFYSYQEGIFGNLFKRIKIAFNVIFRGDYFLHDLILSRKDFERLRDYINEIAERGKNK